MVNFHRCNENFSAVGNNEDELVSYQHTKPIGYGLKKLMLALFNTQAVTLEDITHGDHSTSTVDPAVCGGYCVRDCENTWRVYQYADAIIQAASLPPLIQMDEASYLPILQMLLNGIPADVNEVKEQIAALEGHISQCTQEIYKRLDLRPALETQAQVKAVLLKLGCLPPDTKEQRGQFYRLLSITEDKHRRQEIIDQIDELPEEGQLAREMLIREIKKTDSQLNKEVLALLIARQVDEQRLSRFLRPMLDTHVNSADGRIYVHSFLSLTATARFTCKPNFQSLPKKAEKPGINKTWIEKLPAHLRQERKTRKIIAATPGHVLISMDLSNAEPRYCAVRMEQVLQDKGNRLIALRKGAWEESRARYPDLFRWADDCRIRTPEPVEPIFLFGFGARPALEWLSSQRGPISADC